MFLALKNKLINKSEIMTFEIEPFETTLTFITKDLDRIHIVYNLAEDFKKAIEYTIFECNNKEDIDLFEVIDKCYVNLKNISSIQIVDDSLKNEPVSIIEILWKGNKNLPQSFIRERLDDKEKEKLIKIISERGLK